ncbi:hypothetical protein BB561_004460 [Smittium simulii]|uniref:Uncharacterized protein n=1 Tax=Smittium simulii TaxID=133385 RepID=A0A2T9YGA9_9FUNG|nr:hypothetical protein BB561_004460 [Smittium simulii]
MERKQQSFQQTQAMDAQNSESATPAVCKNNAALYGIQMALANMIRPLKDYVLKKLKDPATSQIKNLHKLMEFPGRVPQLFEPTLKPTVKNKQLDALLASKKVSTKNRSRKGVPFVCASRMRMIQYPQRRIPLKTPPKPQSIQQITPRPEKLQNVITDIHMQDNQEEGLHGPFTEFPYLYKGIAPSYKLVLSSENQSLSIFGRFVDNKQFQRELHQGYTRIIIQIAGTRCHDWVILPRLLLPFIISSNITSVDTSIPNAFGYLFILPTDINRIHSNISNSFCCRFCCKFWLVSIYSIQNYSYVSYVFCVDANTYIVLAFSIFSVSKSDNNCLLFSSLSLNFT